MLKRMYEQRGIPISEIAERIGYHENHLNNIRSGRLTGRSPKFVRETLANRVRQLEIETRGIKGVPNTRAIKRFRNGERTRRALQALAYQGYTCEKVSELLAEQFDWKPEGAHLRKIMSGVHSQVTVNTEKRIVAVCRAVGHEQGPSRIAAERARAKGYKPAAFWDDLL
jgi:transposase-like protein